MQSALLLGGRQASRATANIGQRRTAARAGLRAGMLVRSDTRAGIHLALPDALVLADALAGAAHGRPRGVDGRTVLAGRGNARGLELRLGLHDGLREVTMPGS
uniref:Uncharacterized protein n=2 Tax=Ralstonia solanacearum TaxID=305 RepID=A0A0S4TWM9_RALSL|nr:conserved protein of unknown function [Ralstonia solanacearum]